MRILWGLIRPVMGLVVTLGLVWAFSIQASRGGEFEEVSIFLRMVGWLLIFPLLTIIWLCLHLTVLWFWKGWGRSLASILAPTVFSWWLAWAIVGGG